MIEEARRHAFAAAVAEIAEVMPDIVSVRALAALVKEGDTDALERLAAVLARVAVVTPEATQSTYDALAAAWLGWEPQADLERDFPAALIAHSETPPPAFWAAFWGIVEDSARGLSAGEITARVAALPHHLAADFLLRAEMVARAHPGAAAAAQRAMPPRLALETLAAQPPGSLARDFHRLITENGFDLEVLDRDALGLRHLPPALRYLNTRILQMHDIWHLVGGYATTALHEIAISSFQLAQFGHNYSAMFLATIVTAARFNFPAGASVILQVIAEAWRHGRESPSFMAISWEEEWQCALAEIRERHSISPFTSALPADLIERTRAAQA